MEIQEIPVVPGQNTEFITAGVEFNTNADTTPPLELVKFKVNYPKEHKGGKFLEEDSTIEIHHELAKNFERQRIGKIVK